MERQYIAHIQSDLCRNQYRIAVRLLLALSLLSLVLVCAIAWQLLVKKIPQTYYASIADGQIVSMKPEKAGA